MLLSLTEYPLSMSPRLIPFFSKLNLLIFLLSCITFISQFPLSPLFPFLHPPPLFPPPNPFRKEQTSWGYQPNMTSQVTIRLGIYQGWAMQPSRKKGSPKQIRESETSSVPTFRSLTRTPSYTTIYIYRGPRYKGPGSVLLLQSL